MRYGLTMMSGLLRAFTNRVQGWTRQQYYPRATLVDTANIAWDLNTQPVAMVTLTDNRTLSNPSNMVNGGVYNLIVKQDAGGTNTLAYGNAYMFPGGTAPTLSTGGNAIDILSFISDGTNMFGVFQGDFST